MQSNVARVIIEQVVAGWPSPPTRRGRRCGPGGHRCGPGGHRDRGPRARQARRPRAAPRPRTPRRRHPRPAERPAGLDRSPRRRLTRAEPGTRRAGRAHGVRCRCSRRRVRPPVPARPAAQTDRRRAPPTPARRAAGPAKKKRL
ncbi:hypothetical protein HBB16_17085 [Pseudonocardia sp. MCCB 268]|nr:hypothetical protein [Pseudonocardia cytotoxica]